MKKVLFFFLAILFVISCNEKKQEVPKNADVLVDNLKGKVDETTETDYKTDSTGKIGEQDSCCVINVKYDEKGYISAYSSAHKNGSEKEEEIFIHNDNGTMKSLKNTKNGTPVSAISIQIDKDGKYKTAQETDSTNKLSAYYTDLTENDYGQLTSLKKYKPDSTLESSMTSTYDKQFFKSNEVKDSVGKVTYSSTVKLDDKNNVIQRATKTVTKDSTINKVTTYKYISFDDNGNWTQRTEMDENGKPVKITKRVITYYKE